MSAVPFLLSLLFYYQVPSIVIIRVSNIIIEIRRLLPVASPISFYCECRREANIVDGKKTIAISITKLYINI